MVILLLMLAGCGQLRYYNTTASVDKRARAHKEGWTGRFLKNNYYYPVRDVFDPRVWASLFDPDEPRAWDVDSSGDVPAGSFYAHRAIDQITPDRAGLGPASGPLPKAPWKLIKARDGKIPVSFIAEDATGRRFMVKLDDPDYPEARSAAAVIATRVLWLLGYHVPANYVVTIEGTGVAEYDGRRAEASLFIEGEVLGQFKFDWLRYRRQMRGLRLACAWLDDVDRSANNTLLVFRDGRSTYYLLDFDSTLGLWKGRPKMPWLGHRHFWDPNWAAIDVLSLGLLSRSQVRHRRPVSKAVGIYYADDFDPLAWKNEHPNSAFRFMSRADRNWMIERIAKITPDQLRAIVKAAKYSNPQDEEHVFRTLRRRQDKILRIKR